MKKNTKNLIVKDNSLVSASYNLDLVEQRLVLLAIIKIREIKYKEEEEHLSNYDNNEVMLSVRDYVDVFKVHPNTAYESLRLACKTLFDKKFVYQRVSNEGVIENVTSRWVQRIAYANNEVYVKIKFSSDVEPLILNLEKNFTAYELKQIADLGSGYAVRVYELVIAWRATGQTPFFELADFRNKLGILETQYAKMSQFKEKVLNKAVEQINAHTDIFLSYEQHKKGRTITGFSFQFQHKKRKQEQLESIPNISIEMTDAQRYVFASKLSELPEMSKYSQGTETYQQFAVRISEMLIDPKNIQNLWPYLEKVGFNKK